MTLILCLLVYISLQDGLKVQKMKTALKKKKERVYQLGLIVLCPWAALLKLLIFTFFVRAAA